MKLRIYFALLLLLVLLMAWIGEQFIHDPGYVLINYQGIVIETSVWLPCVLLGLGAGVLILIWELGRRLLGAPSDLRRWWGERYIRVAHEDIFLGLIKFAEGDWSRAEKLFVKLAHRTDQPLIHYLYAAQAAHEQGDYDRRDNYLKEALTLHPEHTELAVGLTQAKLQYEQKQWEQCYETLQRVRKIAPKNKQGLKLLARVQKELKA